MCIRDSVNGERSPFILIVDKGGWLCYFRTRIGKLVEKFIYGCYNINIQIRTKRGGKKLEKENRNRIGGCSCYFRFFIVYWNRFYGTNICDID